MVGRSVRIAGKHLGCFHRAGIVLSETDSGRMRDGRGPPCFRTLFDRVWPAVRVIVNGEKLIKNNLTSEAYRSTILAKTRSVSW